MGKEKITEDDRDDLSPARGFFNATLIGIVFWSLMLLVIANCTGCAPHIITKDWGRVVKVTEYSVEVAYQVINRAENVRVANIYYKPCGHAYKLGDMYPDIYKEALCDPN